MALTCELSWTDADRNKKRVVRKQSHWADTDSFRFVNKNSKRISSSSVTVQLALHSRYYVSKCVKLVDRFASFPFSHLLKFPLAEAKGTQANGLLANANKCQHGNMDAPKPAFYFWDANTLDFPVSWKISIFILRQYPPCLSFPWLWKKINWKRTRSKLLIVCCGLVRCLNLVVLMN